jgi:hypothetical protein
MIDSPRAYWPIWIDSLRKQGLMELTTWLLEAAGPLNALGAQLIYVGQPFVPSTTSQSWQALANLLEQEDETRAFTALLKGRPQ